MNRHRVTHMPDFPEGPGSLAPRLSEAARINQPAGQLQPIQ